MSEKKIHKIIDLYFEAQLSRAEEEALFHSLLAFKGNDQKVDEALAVMLMTRMPMESRPSGLRPEKPMESRPSGLRPEPRRLSGQRPVIAVAASIALIFAMGATALWHYSNKPAAEESGGIIAYVGGVKVSDNSEVMKIVDDQLNDIGISSELFAQTIAEDLDDIVDAFNEEGI